jgi:hypothetical protein
MADRLLALYGTGKGPVIPVKGEVCLVVQGLPAGSSEERVLAILTGGVFDDIAIHQDGEYPLPDGVVGVQCDHQGSNKRLSCIVVSR